MLQWLTALFVKSGDSPEAIRVTRVFLTMWLTLTAWMMIVLPSRELLYDIDHADPSWQLDYVLNFFGISALLYCLAHLRCFGFGLGLKVFTVLSAFIYITGTAVNSPDTPWHFVYVLVLDFCLVFSAESDAVTLTQLAYLLSVPISTYICLHVMDRSDMWITIHPFEVSGSALTGFCTSMVPLWLNFVLMKSYVASARKETSHVNDCAEVARLIAEKLVNFDLEGAEMLLTQKDTQSPVHAPLHRLLHNLRSYRPFLPHSLFSQAEVRDPPNELIARSMKGATTTWERAWSAVRSLRDPEYTPKAFREDVESAFPELQLYNACQDHDTSMEKWSESSVNEVSKCSSGLLGSEEQQRTMGAMYSVYCLARLDIDGKEAFTFGLDECGRPLAGPRGEAADKRLDFYKNMDWNSLTQLFVRADLLAPSSSRNFRINEERMMAFLVLTAVHDVMKNPQLSPTVQKRHSPYLDHEVGSCISDHDTALAYIMEHFPGLLPSYNGLEPGQRAPILFTQGKMGFNNGWLVQGEAPPGALFSMFKRVIVQGRYSEADVAFYFAHWLTDLAGSELHGEKPWPGAEKFVLKFPRRVLFSFLESFTFVDNLVSKSEVQVMEEYLQSRWLALGICRHQVPNGCILAAMRLALMAQGFEAQAVAALDQLSIHDRDVIAEEMARTGHQLQFQEAPESVHSKPMGPALLVYYAPALIQKAKAAEVFMALQVLAAVYRAARRLFPASPLDAEKTAIVRIDVLKVLLPSDIMVAKQWHLRKVSHTEAEAVAGAGPLVADASATPTCSPVDMASSRLSPSQYRRVESL